MTGPLLSHSGAAAHEAIERAIETLRQGWPLLRSWDGLPPEVMELLVAQARLSALLASTVAKAYSDLDAVDVLSALAEQQIGRGDRLDSVRGWGA